MFCFQCEQTAKGKGCAGKAGVCGKKSATALLQDKLTGGLITLARNAAEKRDGRTDALMVNGLFATLTNVNFDDTALQGLLDAVHAEEARLLGKEEADFSMETIWKANEDIRSLKSLLLFGARGIAAYDYHVRALGNLDDTAVSFLYRALAALVDEGTVNSLLLLVMEAGKVNLTVMEQLDKANTGAFGTPAPTKVTMTIEKGPFIVITGHDLRDLSQLLEQTAGKGVNVYTHGEMLPAHAYPAFKKYPHFKGNFGTAWQNQRQEFHKIPAPILFTTNCLMPPQSSYADRVFTTGPTAFSGCAYIAEKDGKKDFSPLIKKALELGGYKKDLEMTGANKGSEVTTGFARDAVLANAPAIIDAVKAGAIKHFFLVGGCDGAESGRNYYTDFVKAAPKDTIILTLGCGKYRFNDMDIGCIGGFPRIMDMGQCNDAYSAIKVALALADAFNCGVNDLPLTLVLSWFEQKAVSILLTLLSLGIKNIYLGPSLPAFVSPTVLKYLVDNFNITPTGKAKDDLAKILAK
jgi:hydroxylamine reductase